MYVLFEEDCSGYLIVTPGSCFHSLVSLSSTAGAYLVNQPLTRVYLEEASPSLDRIY